VSDMRLGGRARGPVFCGLVMSALQEHMPCTVPRLDGSCEVHAIRVQWKTALQMVGISALLVLRESQRLLGNHSASIVSFV
jgi:hypothetical protein